MTADHPSSGCEWIGMSLIASVQVAAGAVDLDRRTAAPLVRTIVDAVQRVQWTDVPFLEFVVARSVVARFLCGVASRQGLAGLPAAMVLRLEGAPPELFNETVADAVRQLLSPHHAAAVTRHVDGRVQAVLEQIQSQCERRLRVDDLAQAVGLSRWHLERLTKQNTGSSPRQHLVAARMARAITLLQETRLSIKELAFRVGYGNANAFTRDFRKSYGTPPRTWLRVHSQDAASPDRRRQYQRR